MTDTAARDDADVLDVDPEPEDLPPVEPDPEPVVAPAVVEPDAAATTALAAYEPTGGIVPTGVEFEQLAALAKILSDSGLVPRALRSKPHDVMLVMLTARDLNISLTTALRKCYPIDGQISIAPALKIAMVEMQGKGRVRPPGPFLLGVTDVDGKRVADPDYPNDRTHATAVAYGPDGRELGRMTLTWEDVAGITFTSWESSGNQRKQQSSNLVDKDNWKNYPARMLWWRVAGYLVDDWFPSVALGLYSPDELGGMITAEGEVIDVDSVEVPVAFQKQQPGGRRRAPGEDPPAPELVDAEQAALWRARANQLPGKARVEIKRILTEGGNNPDDFPAKLPARKARTIDALLDSIEKRAHDGEWGDWSPTDTPEPGIRNPESEIEDAVVLCPTCGEDEERCATVGCGADHDTPPPAVPDVFEHGEEPFDPPTPDPEPEPTAAPAPRTPPPAAEPAATLPLTVPPSPTPTAPPARRPTVESGADPARPLDVSDVVEWGRSKIIAESVRLGMDPNPRDKVRDLAEKYLKAYRASQP